MLGGQCLYPLSRLNSLKVIFISSKLFIYLGVGGVVEMSFTCIIGCCSRTYYVTQAGSQSPIAFLLSLPSVGVRATSHQTQ